MVEHEMDMVDEMMDGKNEATTPMPILTTVAWDEHTAEAGWSGKVPTSIGSSNLATDDWTEDWTLSVRPGQLSP